MLIRLNLYLNINTLKKLIMNEILEEKNKSNTCIKIANTFCLLATTIIIFFIYLSLNDKLSDVDELTKLASEFFRLSNNYMLETKPQIDNLIDRSLYLVNTTEYYLEEYSEDGLNIIFSLQKSINNFNTESQETIHNLNTLLISVNNTLNSLNNLIKELDYT